MKHFLCLLCFCIGLCGYSHAQTTQTITASTLAELNAAIQTANTNDKDSTIILLTPGIYEISTPAVANAIDGEGNQGATGLTVIMSANINFPNKRLLIRRSGATGEVIIRRKTTASNFRLMFYLGRRYIGNLGATPVFGTMKLYLQNLTLENGNSSFQGGAIYVSFESQLNVQNCTFNNNATSVNKMQGGGAIAIRARSESVMTNCRFINNRTTFSCGGAICNVLSNLTLTGCRFTNNSAYNAAFTARPLNGGAYYNDGAKGENGFLKVMNCVFEGNQANIGGGVYLFPYNQNITTIENSTFRNNKALGANRANGGGLCYQSGIITQPPTYTGTTNQTQLTVRNSVFHGNTSEFVGGGVTLGIQQGTARMINCTVTNNRAALSNNQQGQGGGVYVNNAAISLLFCTISGNYAGGQAGGIGHGTQGHNLTLRNCIIAHNQANNNGANNKYKKNCQSTFAGSHNVEFPAPIPGNPLDPTCSCLNTCNLILQDPQLGQLTDNGGSTLTMPISGSSPAKNAGTSATTPPVPTDQRGNTRDAQPDIGAFEITALPPSTPTPILLSASANASTQIELLWQDNATSETGFVIERAALSPFNFAELAQLSGENTAPTATFTDNTALPNTTYYYRVKVLGDGFPDEWSNLVGATTSPPLGYCDNSGFLPVLMYNPEVVVVGDGTPSSCTAAALQTALNTGGKIICNCGNAPTQINLTQELLVTKDSTVLDGGGLVSLNGGGITRILNVKEGIDFTLQNITLKNGKAPASGGLFAESGGAILVGSGVTGLGGGKVLLVNCQFQNNTLTKLNTQERGGGAVYAYRLRDLLISNCTFDGNQANVGGAVGNLGSQVRVVNTIFKNNIAKPAPPAGFLSGVGGAMYHDGIDLWDASNTAPEHVLSLCGCSFVNNQARGEGGAVYSAISDSKRNKYLVDKCLFENNQLVETTIGNGGAIFHVEDDYAGNTETNAFTNLEIRNSAFVGNSSVAQGGGVWVIVGGKAIIENNTFDNNQVNKAGAGLGAGLAISSAGYGGNYDIQNNTFSNNYTAHFGAGMFAAAPNVIQLRNNLFAYNTADFEWEGHQLAGNATWNDGGDNFKFPENRWNGTQDNVPTAIIATYQDPLLQPLGFNGGITPTRALAAGSPALNKGNAGCGATDQRGFPRVGACDVGAYEFGSVASNPPIISSFSPASGALGSTVSIVGQYFQSTLSVAFNGAPASAYTVNGAGTVITTTVPDLATTGKISVSTPNGVAQSIDDFVVNIPLPTITSFSPSLGGAGTIVDITGTDLRGTTAVRINGINIPVFQFIAPDIVRLTIPANATSGKFHITTGGGSVESAADFSVTPALSSFEPMLGAAGVSVVIRGVNLLGTTEVEFGGVLASVFVVNNATTITATVPAAALTGKIRLKAGDGNDYLSADDFVIVPPPTITAFSPTSGGRNTLVKIEGTNLTYTQGVKFGTGQTAFFTLVYDSPTLDSLYVNVPNNATTGKITLITPGGTAESLSDFIVRPSINRFQPNSAGVNSEVVIEGTNLGTATQIWFGGESSTAGAAQVSSVVAQNDTTLRVLVPAGLGVANYKERVRVYSPDAVAGFVASTDSFLFVPAPTLSGFVPASARAGDVVRLGGTNLASVQAVSIGGIDSDVFIFYNYGSTDSLFITIPDAAISGAITVETLGGSAITATSLQIQPSIYSISPLIGIAGDIVEIDGANLSEAQTATFYTAPNEVSVSITPAMRINATRLRVPAPVPVGAFSGKIRIVSSNGLFELSADDFTHLQAPTLSNVSPAAAPVGATISLTGTNFVIGESQVFFPGNPSPVQASVEVNSSTQATVIVPQGALDGNLTLTTPAGTAAIVFDVLPSLPEILSFSPSQGPEGTVVSITGDKLSQTTQVQIGGISTNFTINGNSQISFTVPSGLTIGNAYGIEVITPDGSDATNDATPTTPPTFTLQAQPNPPVINSFSPGSGAVGTVVTLNGNYFLGASVVKFNGIDASFTILNNVKIQATVPAGASTGKIAITTLVGTGQTSNNFIVNQVFRWTGAAGNTNWFDANNWNPPMPPNSATADVEIPNVSPNPYPILTLNAEVEDIQIRNGASLTVANSARLSLYGNLTNSGSLTAANGNLTFAGTLPQTLPFNLPLLESLTINNPAGVHLGRNITITDRVEFVQGNLNLSGFVLSLSANAFLQGESNTRRILGNSGSVVIARSGLNSLLNSGINLGALGANIQIPSAAGVSGLTIRRGHTQRLSGVTRSILRYYVITTSGGAAPLNAQLTFGYWDNELDALNESTLELRRFDTGCNCWEKKGGVLDAIANTLTLGGIAQFSEWTAGDVSAALPIQLLTLQAKRSHNHVILTWQVGRTASIRGFAISASSDGMVYRRVAQQDARTSTQYQYTLYDMPLIRYYRVESLLADGSVGAWAVARVEDIGREGFNLYPNPTAGEVEIQFPLHTPPNIRLELIDFAGRVLWIWQGDTLEASTQLSRYLASQSSGIYALRLTHSAQRYHQRLVIQR